MAPLTCCTMVSWVLDLGFTGLGTHVQMATWALVTLDFALEKPHLSVTVSGSGCNLKDLVREGGAPNWSNLTGRPTKDSGLYGIVF